MVMGQDEKDRQRQKFDDKRAAQKRKEVQQAQLLQIGERQGAGGNLRSDGSELGSSTGFAGGPLSVSSYRRRKGPQGSHMSLEELRINKGLLMEISKKKKQGGVGEQISAVQEEPELHESARNGGVLSS